MKKTVLFSIIACMSLGSRMFAMQRTQEEKNQRLIQKILVKGLYPKDIRELIQDGANVNAKHTESGTPVLTIAVGQDSLHDRLQIIEYLINQGANVNAKSSLREILPSRRNLQLQNMTPKMIDLIQNLRNDKNCTALTVATYQIAVNPTSEGSFNIIKLLIKKEASVTQKEINMIQGAFDALDEITPKIAKEKPEMLERLQNTKEKLEKIKKYLLDQKFRQEDMKSRKQDTKEAFLEEPEKGEKGVIEVQKLKFKDDKKIILPRILK